MRHATLAGAVLLIAAFGTATPASAELFGPSKQVVELQQRVERLEQMLNSGGLMDLVSRMDRQQQEIQDLRGQVETLNHTIESLRKQQRDLYVDLDRRIGQAQAGTMPPPVDGGGSTGVEPPPTTPSVPPISSASADPVAEQRAYEQAFGLLKEGRYADAGASFQQFLRDYPGGSYAPNAQYWLGESYYVTRRFDEALAAFQSVQERYPDSGKVADAMLKIGYIHYEKGEREKAKAVFQEIQQRFPNTTAASLAARRLKGQ